jgi:hypothetical protein
MTVVHAGHEPPHKKPWEMWGQAMAGKAGRSVSLSKKEKNNVAL